MSIDLVELAAEAYIYGFPLVFDLEQVQTVLEHGMGSVPAAPFNAFGHATQLAGPQDTFVSINNDTVYSIAQRRRQRRPGPPRRARHRRALLRAAVRRRLDQQLRLRRSSGDRHRGRLVPAGPARLGRDGCRRRATVIRFPTDVATIVGRWAVDGEADLPAVRGAAGALTPDADRHPGARCCPQPDPGVAEELAFFEQLRVWMQAFPPARARSRLPGSGSRRSGCSTPTRRIADPDPSWPPPARGTRRRARADGARRCTHGSSPKQNGWNADLPRLRLQPRLLRGRRARRPTWKLDDRPGSATSSGRWPRGRPVGQPRLRGRLRDGLRRRRREPARRRPRYQLRFATAPPVGAFWSVTMYDTPDFFLVANPIDRYSIGDRTPGLHTADDGSLTIFMQHDEPDRPRRARQLAADPERGLSPDPAHVRARSAGVRRRLRAAADHAHALTPPTTLLQGRRTGSAIRTAPWATSRSPSSAPTRPFGGVACPPTIRLCGPDRTDRASYATHLNPRRHKPGVPMIALADQDLVVLCRGSRLCRGACAIAGREGRAAPKPRHNPAAG